MLKKVGRGLERGVEIRPFHLIFRVDHLVQLLSQFVDFKFRSERQVNADLLFPLFWCFILKSMDLSEFEKSGDALVYSYYRFRILFNMLE